MGTKKDICFVNNDPFDVVKSHFCLGALGRGLIARFRQLVICFVLIAVPPSASCHLQQLVWGAYEDVDSA